MKAIQVREFGSPEVMKLTEVPDPQAGPGQVVVRVHAAGVNPVETYIRAGTYASKPPLPYTPGSDAAGVVATVGPGVTRFTPGDRVYTAGTLSGAYAELALCEEKLLFPLPANISFSQGACLHVPYATAYRALFQSAGARPGQTVLVHGASGGVGLAAVQFAVAAELRVIGTAGTEAGRQLVREQHAALVLDHHAPGYLDELMRFTEGRGVEVILEMLANANLGKDLTVLARSGVIAVIGCRGEVQINPRLLMRAEGSITGVMLGQATDLPQIHRAIGAGLQSGALRPVVGREFSLAEAAQAHHTIVSAAAHGKIVLIPSPVGIVP